MADGETFNCIFCDMQVTLQPEMVRDVLHVRCPNCGRYDISPEAWGDFRSLEKGEYFQKRHLISGYIREENDLGHTPVTITTHDFAPILGSAQIPKTIIARMDRLLTALYRKTEFFGHRVTTMYDQPSIAYAKNTLDLFSICGALDERRLLTLYDGSDNQIHLQTIQGNYEEYNPSDLLASCSLTAEGMERVEQASIEINSKQCFVAMRFNDDMDNIYRQHIMPTVLSVGYECLRIDQKEHNDNICDQIIAELRRSRFVIADFTGQRGGVYFEAGFAYGLGIPVIWTCKADEIKDLHFDVNHYNFITWKTGDELAEKLKQRIQATIINS